MTTDATTVAIAAAIDTLALVQAQLDRVERSNVRIEANQRDILERLDAIDAGQAAVTDLLPVLEMILARSIEDRELSTASFSRVAQLAAFAHAAALGNGGPLPAEAVDDQLLTRYLLTQPADRTSTARALVEWRGAVGSASSTELSDLLARQYRPSPTDTRETRVLRYQLAAIARAELEGRGVIPPLPPSSTVAEDRSSEATRARHAELASLWRAGGSLALFGEPELAGALDLFAQAERGGGVDENRLSADLASLHRLLGDRVAAGERPSLADHRPGGADGNVEIQLDRQR